MLKLSNNELEMVPHEMGDMASLRQLELGGNQLWHLPATFSKLQNIRYLNLSRNRFDQLPLCACSMKNLEALDVHGNQLNNLPPDFSDLKSLKELSIANNNIQTLPHPIFTLRHLHSLDASYNQMRSLPHQISQIPKLRMLVLQGNQLASLPPNLDSLHHLNIANNIFQNLSVIRMRQLRHLNGSHNNLENMPLGSYNLGQLEVMKLNNNHISYLSQDIILLKKLRVLDLANNHLTNLPQVIDELEKLEVFNIKGNKVEGCTIIGGRTPGVMGGTPGGHPYYGLPNGHHPLNHNPYGPNPYGENPHGPQPYGQNPYGLNHAKYVQQHTEQPGPVHVQTTQYDTPNGLLAIPGGLKHRHSSHRKGLPVYRKRSLPRRISVKRKKSKATKRPFFTMRSKKNRSTQHVPTHSRQVATQYTPRSTIRERHPPTIEVNQAADTQAHRPSKSIMNGTLPKEDASSVPNGTVPNMNTIQHDLQSLNISSHNPVVKSNPFSVSEISYPMVSTPVQNHTSASLHHNHTNTTASLHHNHIPASLHHNHTNTPASLHHNHTNIPAKKQESASYTQDWVDERNHEGGSGGSNAVTINEAIGDNLSLGDEDFQFVPTNIPDRKLMRICREAETLLNTELLRPLQNHKGIFRKRYHMFIDIAVISYHLYLQMYQLPRIHKLQAIYLLTFWIVFQIPVYMLH